MSQDLSLRKAVVAVIVSATIAALVFLAVGWVVPAIVVGGLAAVLGLELGAAMFQGRERNKTNQVLIEKASAQAASGRKLVIYERETGLFAHWYITLRCDEECYRARRYNHGLTVAVIEPAPDTEEPWVVQDFVANWLRRQLRKADLAAYVGNGGYVVLMPQSEPAVSLAVVGRLQAEIDGVDVGLSSFPGDGSDYEELITTARERLHQTAETAA
ncbi:MAG: hypothetical protein WBD55_03315 [Dehalococcoidia bacterium]